MCACAHVVYVFLRICTLHMQSGSPIRNCDILACLFFATVLPRRRENRSEKESKEKEIERKGFTHILPWSAILGQPYPRCWSPSRALTVVSSLLCCSTSSFSAASSFPSSDGASAFQRTPRRQSSSRRR